jgi:hypothetical protein
MGGQRADLESAVVEAANTLQVAYAAQPNDVPGLNEALLQEQHQGRTTSHEVRVLAIRSQQLEGCIERLRSVVIK